VHGSSNGDCVLLLFFHAFLTSSLPFMHITEEPRDSGEYITDDDVEGGEEEEEEDGVEEEEEEEEEKSEV
jgi:hypothetical protein